MQKSDGRIIVSAAVCCLVLLCASVLLAVGIARNSETVLPVSAQPAASASAASAAGISFIVRDGETDEPLGDVRVVVPEAGYSGVTGGDGTSGEISVPALRDASFDAVVPRDWCEVSAIFYKSGYAPYAVFYLQVREGKCREHVEILMFKTASLSSDRALSIIEGPDREWVNAVVEKYRK